MNFEEFEEELMESDVEIHNHKPLAFASKANAPHALKPVEFSGPEAKCAKRKRKTQYKGSDSAHGENEQLKLEILVREFVFGSELSTRPKKLNEPMIMKPIVSVARKLR